MKKLFMLLGFILVNVAVFAQSEDDKTKKIELWTRAIFGLGFSDKTGNDPAYSPTPSIQLGLRTRIANLSDDAVLDVGAEYSMQGGKYKSMNYEPGGTYGSSSATSRLSYINFPVLVSYQKQQVGFFAEAGVQPGLLISAKDRGENIKADLKKLDVGIPVGVGYNFTKRIGIGLRVTPGLMNINKDDVYKNRNLVGSLRATYAF